MTEDQKKEAFKLLISSKKSVIGNDLAKLGGEISHDYSKLKEKLELTTTKIDELLLLEKEYRDEYPPEIYSTDDIPF